MELAKDAAEPITARKRKADEDEKSSESKATENSTMAAEGSDPNPSPKPNPNPIASSPCSVVELYDGWSCSKDNDIMQQHNTIRAEEAAKIPYVGDKEPLFSLAAEFQSGNPIIQEKIKLIGEQYAALRRTRGDGNCFFRSFMFSYLEHILETQDKAEVERITLSIDECKKTLQSLGYADFTFEDFFSIFLEQLESVLQGTENSISHEELLQRSRDQNISDYVVMFFRFVISGEIRRRSDFFEPFIAGLTNSTVDKFCKTSLNIKSLGFSLESREGVGEMAMGASRSGLLKILPPKFRPQPADIAASAGWGVAATVTALWLVQPFDWLKKKLFEMPEPK